MFHVVLWSQAWPEAGGGAAVLQWRLPGQGELLCLGPVRPQRHGGTHRQAPLAVPPQRTGVCARVCV